MSTTLANARIELSKQLGDYWAGTTTSGGSTVTLVDTALMAKQNDWITKETYDLITATAPTYTGEERLVSSLDNSSGTLTTLAHSDTIATSIAYEVHRLFSASEKRLALIAAARMSYPAIFKEIQDESLVSGNWLKDGSFEIWTTATNLTYWTESLSTVTRTSTAGQFKHGSYGAVLSGDAGNLSRTITNDDELMRLAGKSVTFTVQGKCSTASCLRIGIYDGSTTTKSDYIDQNTGWTPDNTPLTVTATIRDHPDYVTFYIYQDATSATSYVDDARVITSENAALYIGNLGLQRNRPHQVFIEPSNYYTGGSWLPIRNWVMNSATGYIQLPDSVPKDRNLRFRGIGCLNFYTSAYTHADSTLWTATIDIDQPQLDILIAQATLYLYTQMSMPNFSQGTREKYMEMIGYWKQELADRTAKFRMIAPPAMVQWT